MKRPRKSNGRGVYAAYVFRDKDPAIDVLRKLIDTQVGHHVNGSDLSKITKDGGPSTTCMRAWFFGDTKRPQNSTMEAAGRALGYERVWKKMRE